MIENILLYSLLAIGGLLAIVGDPKMMMIGVLVAIFAVFRQERWEFYDLAVAIDSNFAILETRLREHLNPLHEAA